MVSMSEVIAFLWNLMRDEDAKSHFEQDPQGALDDCGLSGVTANDIRDAQTMLQDSGLAHPRAGASGSGGHDDPVDEIRHTWHSYVVDRSMTIDNNQTFTVVDINEETTVVRDSFNSGDTTTDVTAIQDNDTTNNIDLTHVEDSFNDGPSGHDPVGDTDQSGGTDQSTADDPAADDPAGTADDPAADDPAADDAADTADDPGADPTAGTGVDEDCHPLPAPDAQTEPVPPEAEIVEYVG